MSGRRTEGRRLSVRRASSRPSHTFATPLDLATPAAVVMITTATPRLGLVSMHATSATPHRGRALLCGSGSGRRHALVFVITIVLVAVLWSP